MFSRFCYHTQITIFSFSFFSFQYNECKWIGDNTGSRSRSNKIKRVGSSSVNGPAAGSGKEKRPRHDGSDVVNIYLFKYDDIWLI